MTVVQRENLDAGKAAREKCKAVVRAAALCPIQREGILWLQVRCQPLSSPTADQHEGKLGR